MAKLTEVSNTKKVKHAHPRDSKKERNVKIPSTPSTGDTAVYSAFRRQLKGMNINTGGDDHDEVDMPVTRKRRKGATNTTTDEDDSGGGGSKISMKYVALMSLMLMPGFLDLLMMSGGLYGSAMAAVAWLSDPRHALLAVLAVAVPTLLYRLLPARMVTLLFVVAMFTTVTIPTASVYLCSPVALNYTDFGTNYSLRLPAADIAWQAVAPCVRRFPLAVYRFSALSPQLSLVVRPGDVVNVNITSSHDSPLPYRLLMAKSGRSVKGRWHLIFLLAKVPRRLAMRDVFTEFLEDKRDDAAYVLRGKLHDTPKNMKPMQQQLAADKLMRPMMFDVFAIEPFT